ncbi:hypothetical protein [Methylocapsa palsarum]|uniref:DUF308 domain-containing protein n=1 Tax=Methylocapsa palsarum TaxID=1612308 RepID=A0A1I3XTP6_9HYPH|nr:hypothetical protein [Methylocapsa palsarum]SFK22669.1 hypothetical protein SAMN05444581_10464 [Methylocapsa palsarum]
MSYVVFAFGLALSIGGAFAMYFGYGIISVERGWASLIAGAAALSGGVVTMALGLILNSLSNLRTVLEAEPSAIPLPGEVRLYPDEDFPGPSYAESFQTESFQAESFQDESYKDESFKDESFDDTFQPEALEAHGPGPDLHDAPENASWPQPRPAAETMEDIRRAVAEKVRARIGILEDRAEETIAPPEDEEPGRPGVPSAAREIADDEFDETEDYDPRSVERSEPEWSGRAVDDPGAAASRPAYPDQRQSETARPSEESAALEPAPAQVQGDEGRVIIRRYESAGTVYVMYADGSIEAQSEHGIMHFETMTELKAFMEAQQRSPS